MKRNLLVLVIIVFGVSCTSNTIFDKPKDLISKDSMVLLLTDMYLATSAQSQKNKFLEKEENYIALVYEKHKVDSTRFNTSNMYYTSKTDAYTEILQEVKLNLDSLKTLHGEFKKESIKEFEKVNGLVQLEEKPLMKAKQLEVDNKNELGTELKDTQHKRGTKVRQAKKKKDESLEEKKIINKEIIQNKKLVPKHKLTKKQLIKMNKKTKN